MSRSRRAEGPTISLFPFLAVLLCTMGSLLVLLVLFSRSAQRGDNAERIVADARAEEELGLARDNLAWRLEQLRGIRDRTAEDLAKERMRLAGVEENSRALADELLQLERVAQALEAGSPQKGAGEEELAALEARLKSARESLDEKRKELAAKPPAYAVVPYVGAAGTHRRPLYIECCIDGVFLQPEGIRLSPSDFEGPPGPGNPLASALRAAREHIARSSASPDDPTAQPYPLLLVRPSGVMAYYAAREAIQSWGSEFGYQLVDEDWTLTFPPRDPALAEVERRAVEESRERLAWFAQTRPVKPSRPAQQYRAATTRGGVVANGGPSVLGDPSRWEWSNQQKARGFAAGEGEGGGAGPFAGNAAAAAAGGVSGGDGSSSPGVSLVDGGRGVGGAGGSGGDAGASSGRGNRGAGGDRPAGSGVGGGSDNGAPGQEAVSGGSGSAAGRYAGGSAFSGRGGGSPGTGSGGAAGGTESGAAGGAGSAAAGSAGSGAAAGLAAGGGGGGAVAMPGMLQAGGSAGGDAGSMAQTRGKNWASLATADRPVPLTRPIHVECALDELRLLDNAARRVETRIPLGATTADAVDLLVKAVHDRVAGWGIAGDRMYWRPELILSETADGRSRRDDLERLLADSGLDTRRKGDDGIRRLPPVERASAMITSP